MSEIRQKLIQIQSRLIAPKSQFNKFGKYRYRSCEDILEAVKPLLNEVGLTLVITDDIVQVGDRYYVKATSKVCDGENVIFSEAFAREPESKKGMDEAQVTGATSSYARKYALNGLFLIDDTKDADSTNKHENGEKSKVSMPKGVGVIDETQQKELGNIAKSSGYTKQEAYEIIFMLGYTKFSEILKQDFDTIKEELSKSAETWRQHQQELAKETWDES